MKRTELKELLVELGVESPSKELINSLLDAFSNENAELKANYEKQIEELNKKNADDDRVAKTDYDNLAKEHETLKANLVKEQRKNVIRKYKGDEDFMDAILGKVKGESDEEFEKNVSEFLKANPKFTSEVVVKTNSNDPLGKINPDNTPKTMRDAIAEHYNTNK